MSDVECPYCGQEQEVCQDDGHGCEDGKVYEEQCGFCEKYFALTPSISFDFYSKKADCMNGGVHDWRVNQHIYDGYKQYRRCNNCDESEWFNANQEHIA
ncbi:hypothetical protein [uncultured Paraglaciecola sp.]|uniref:hypothetical protein n=1 Tax=uncultured Paraglaciecola sp. TaxID=1765024 RepID=UPI00261639E7|nr:hypothetical protein [uncultured Paraglaciecola sp.]